jgi:hypothetical protein
MDIRKIAVVGGFAVGAALTLAPLASAVPTDPITPATLDSEIASINSLFSSETSFAQIPTADLTTATNAFTTVAPADAPVVTDPGQLTVLDYELFGVKPITAGLSPDPGAYDVDNGALIRFDEAFNVGLYALENNNAIDPNVADYFGSTTALAHALGETSGLNAAEYFYNFGIGDLSGFDATNLSFLDFPGIT